jgi:hypothetical protein
MTLFIAWIKAFKPCDILPYSSEEEKRNKPLFIQKLKVDGRYPKLVEVGHIFWKNTGKAATL